jgi:CheY-like chemotaxis protein
MTVVHNTVRDAGGALDLHTAPGEGTAFALYMPLSPGRVSPATPPDAPGQGQVVLAVEDEPALAALLEEGLAGLGYEPRVFTDPEAALQAFTAEPALFDVLLTDQLMPGMDGLTLLARCRRLAPALPCVVLTGFGGPDFSQRAVAARVDAVLAKPLATQALGQALAAVLAGAPRRD